MSDIDDAPARRRAQSGYWPLYRFHPGHDEHTHPFQLDSKAPSIPLADFLDGRGTLRDARPREP